MGWVFFIEQNILGGNMNNKNKRVQVIFNDKRYDCSIYNPFPPIGTIGITLSEFDSNNEKEHQFHC